MANEGGPSESGQWCIAFLPPHYWAQVGRDTSNNASLRAIVTLTETMYMSDSTWKRTATNA